MTMGLMRAKLAARDGVATIEPDNCFNNDKLECESELYDDKTGDVVVAPNGSYVACTWSFTYFVEHTQKSRDK